MTDSHQPGMESAAGDLNGNGNPLTARRWVLSTVLAIAFCIVSFAAGILWQLSGNSGSDNLSVAGLIDKLRSGEVKSGTELGVVLPYLPGGNAQTHKSTDPDGEFWIGVYALEDGLLTLHAFNSRLFAAQYIRPLSGESEYYFSDRKLMQAFNDVTLAPRQ